MSIYFNVTVCWAMKIVSKSRNKIYSAFYFECTKHFHNLWLFWFHLTRSWLYVAFIRVSIVVHRCHRRRRVITARLYTYLIRLINTFGLDSLYRYFCFVCLDITVIAFASSFLFSRCVHTFTFSSINLRDRCRWNKSRIHFQRSFSIQFNGFLNEGFF